MSVCPTVWCDPFILLFAPAASASGTINAHDECKEEKDSEVKHGRRRGKECRLTPPLSGVLYPLSLSLSLSLLTRNLSPPPRFLGRTGRDGRTDERNEIP